MTTDRHRDHDKVRDHSDRSERRGRHTSRDRKRSRSSSRKRRRRSRSREIDRDDHRKDDRERHRDRREYRHSSDDREPEREREKSIETSVKPKSGILHYLSIPGLSEGSGSGVAKGGKGVGEGPVHRNSSSSSSSSSSCCVNTSVLRRVLDGDKRAGDRYDRRRLEGAQARLEALSAGKADSGRSTEDGRKRQGAPLHLKTVKTATASGAKLRDSFSHGMRPDVAADKDLPYSCDVCAEKMMASSSVPSFLTATQLSDHLERRHGVRRHPSIIRPTKTKKAAPEPSGDGDGEGFGRPSSQGDYA